MDATEQYLSPSETAKKLGVSKKALRLYEECGLLKPLRTAAGWRAYGPAETARATQIVELRSLGLTLAEVTRVLDGDAHVLGRALAAHEAALEARLRALNENVLQVRKLRGELDRGTASIASVVSRIDKSDRAIGVAFALPWPWGGEPFEMADLRRLTCITGPLGSGKTRLAMRMADAIPGASFVGLDRLENDAAASKARLDRDPHLEARVRNSLAMVVAAGGRESDALLALFAALDAENDSVQVVDMIEEGLDAATQEALMCFLRRPAPDAKRLVFLTRSSAILDVDLVGIDETIILCPANHSPPMLVAPFGGSPGYEALVTCLAAPDVRARTAGMVAMRRTA